MQQMTHYLKRLGEWVTDLTDNYRSNPFAQATTNIVVILVIMTWISIVLSNWSIQYAQSNTIGSIQTHIHAVTEGAATDTQNLALDIAGVRARTLLYVYIGRIALAILFGMLLIRFALSPARESLQLQKRFIGNVAHEIRTPLAIIKTTTEVTLMDPSLSPDIRETLTETIVELNRISDIINNLLSFNTLMSPSLLKTQSLDLGDVVEMVRSRHEEFALSRGIMLSTELGAKRMVLGNAIALEQVITNLVKNAINYTPADANRIVKISVQNDYRERVVLAIMDSGIGIAQKDLQHVLRVELEQVRADWVLRL
jgi:signal transduction histidine kinase